MSKANKFSIWPILMILAAYVLAGIEVQAATWSEIQVINLEPGELVTAIDELEAQRKLEGPTPESDLALAVALYRIGEFDRAESLLRRIEGAAFEARGTYHLGRVAHLRGHYSDARGWYEQVSAQDEDLTAQAWADDALLSLLFEDSFPAAAQRSVPQAFAFASVETQWVDGIIDPDDSAATEAADSALALLIAGSAPVWAPNDTTNIRLGGSYYQVDYDEFDAYNIAAASGFSELENRVGNHQWRTRVGISHLWLDGVDYVRQHDLRLTDTISLNSKIDLRLGIRYINVDSPSSQFDRYQGDIYELTGGVASRGRWDWRLDYSYRTEDRQDQQLSFVNDAGSELGGFRSYSRDLHQISARLNWAWNSRWEQELLASVRVADYHDADRFLDSSTQSMTQLNREATRFAFRTEVRRLFSDKFWLTGKIDWLDENANNDLYDFDGLTISFGLEHRF
jgi:hypothetical protein